MSGRGKSQKSLALIDALSLIYAEIHPASVRAGSYQLFIKKLISEMSKANTNAVGTLLVYAREQGLIPWEFVVDETRQAERIATWNNPKEIIEVAVRQYRKDYWATQSVRVEVFSEKGTIRGTLAPVLNKYGVTLRVLHDYGSATMLHDIAEETAENDKPLIILYCGDHDPSGLHMSEIDLPRRLKRYEGRAKIVRVALNDSDVTPNTDLPWFKVESKVKDPRYQWFRKRYGRRCWEVDALSPVILRERVEAEILARLDIDAWNHAVKIERAEIESMGSILSNWQSISMHANKYSPDAAG